MSLPQEVLEKGILTLRLDSQTDSQPTSSDQLNSLKGQKMLMEHFLPLGDFISKVILCQKIGRPNFKNTLLTSLLIHRPKRTWF